MLKGESLRRAGDAITTLRSLKTQRRKRRIIP
jgi:hypothetical protein